MIDASIYDVCLLLNNSEKKNCIMRNSYLKNNATTTTIHTKTLLTLMNSFVVEKGSLVFSKYNTANISSVWPKGFIE